MSSNRIKKVKAIYDYTRKHNDELSFSKNDIITLTQQIDGGWWEGTLNQLTGWFPSNYVTEINEDKVDSTASENKSGADLNLTNFQADIVNHILDGEKKYCTKLHNMLTNFLTPLIKVLNLHESKIQKICDVLNSIIPLHKQIIECLEGMKNISTYRVGRLYLDMASKINDCYLAYSTLHLFVIYSLDLNKSAIIEYFDSQRMSFEWSQIKPQLSLVFDRLGRYPLLLKEMERYLEDGNPDRGDIQRATVVYNEINEKSTVIRKKKERDLDVLCATILGWKGERLSQLGDPVLTIKVGYVGSGASDVQVVMNHVIVVMSAYVILLACTEQADVYAFKAKLPVEDLLLVASDDRNVEMRSELTGECLHIVCDNTNTRNELVSTLKDIQMRLTNSSLAKKPSTAVVLRDRSNSRECGVQQHKINQLPNEPSPPILIHQQAPNQFQYQNYSSNNLSSNNISADIHRQKQMSFLRILRPDPPAPAKIFENSQSSSVNNDNTNINFIQNSAAPANSTTGLNNNMVNNSGNNAVVRTSSAFTATSSGHFSPKATRRRKEEESAKIKDDALILQVIESYCLSSKGSHALDLARLRLSDAEIIRASCDVRQTINTNNSNVLSKIDTITTSTASMMPPVSSTTQQSQLTSIGPSTGHGIVVQHQPMRIHQPRDSSSSSNSGDNIRMQQHHQQQQQQHHHHLRQLHNKPIAATQQPSQHSVSSSSSKPTGCAPLISGKNKRK